MRKQTFITYKECPAESNSRVLYHGDCFKFRISLQGAPTPLLCGSRTFSVCQLPGRWNSEPCIWLAADKYVLDMPAWTFWPLGPKRTFFCSTHIQSVLNSSEAQHFNLIDSQTFTFQAVIKACYSFAISLIWFAIQSYLLQCGV